MFIEKIGEVKDKPIIGMLHLAGEDPVEQALDELDIFEREGLAGAIVEDYHGSKEDVIATMERIAIRGSDILIGINVLSDPYSSFELADKYGAQFVQFDNVQVPRRPDFKGLDAERYDGLRQRFPDVAVFGGVRFKYTPLSGNSLVYDIREAMGRCEVIVTTGEGTGVETPIEKLREFKIIAGNYPVFSGAGVDRDNANEQMGVVDGVIVGSYLKDGDTRERPIKGNIRSLTRIADDLRC